MKCTLLAFLLAAACAAPEAPAPIEGAQVQLSFERSLANLAPAALTAAAHDGAARYKRAKSGHALATRGEGDSVSYEAANKLPLGDDIVIAFEFAAADWENPYRSGRAKKTILDITGAAPGRIDHIAFNLSPGDAPYLEVWFKDAAGDTHRMRAAPELVKKHWNSVRLEIDRRGGETRFLINAAPAASARAVPAAIDNGIDAIRLGTWHKKNQAYRGLIDNVVIADAPAGA